MASKDNSSKKIIFLDFHPEIPESLRKTAKSNKTPKTTHQNQSGPALLNWQLDWMNGFDAMRTELTNQLQDRQKEIVRLNDLIEEKNKASSKLKDVISRKNKKIGKLKASLIDTKSKTKTKTNSDHNEMGKCGAVGCVSFERIQTIHSYAIDQSSVKPPSRKLHKCFNCGFSTHKKSTLNNHYVFCLPNVVKSLSCPICKKPFTYDGLRTHLNYFTSGKHAATNAHANYTPIQHQVLLETIKLQKSYEKK